MQQQKLCKLNIDVAFYLKGNTDELLSNKHFDTICKNIYNALNNIVNDVQIDCESFEVLD